MGLSSSLPSALQKQEEEVNKLIQETYPDAKTSDEGGKPPAAPPKKEPESPEKPTDAKEVETPAAKPAEKPAETPAATPEGFVSKADYDTLLHTHSVLKGKYEAEVPRLSGELRSLMEEIAVLKDKPKAEAPSGDKKDMPTDMEERLVRLKEEYGDEFLEDMYFHFRQKIMEDLDLDGVKAKVETIEKTTTKTRDQSYLDDLNKSAPNWRTLVNDPRFEAYMGQEEGNTGISRLAFAKQHMENRDAARVAKYYTDFEAMQTKPKPPTPTPEDESGDNAHDKESLVAPNTTPSNKSAASETNKADIVTTSEMDKFARDVIQGRYKGREDEARKIQARFDAAQAAGRIVPG